MNFFLLPSLGSIEEKGLKSLLLQFKMCFEFNMVQHKHAGKPQFNEDWNRVRNKPTAYLCQITAL
jgi:hypothetical protein